MKLLIVLLISFSAFAASITTETKCFLMKEDLDRDYCKKKKVSLLKNQFANEQKTWKNGIKSEEKNKKSAQINLSIAEIQEQLDLNKAKLELLKNHKEVLAKTKTIAPKKKKKKKKKKRSDLEKALNIKL